MTAMIVVAAAGVSYADETVDITLPAAVSFSVYDVSASTTGNPDPSAVSFSSANLLSGHALRISMRADAANLTPPAGSPIPASSVSWTTGSAQGGSGSNGSLSSDFWVQVYQSYADPSSGGVDITWILSAPGASVRAGMHTLTATWKLESVVP